jgi:L-threonylcarbamoyladenylate synthase
MKKQKKNLSLKQQKTLHSSFAARLRKGAVGVLPTDTIYGLVGSALLPKAVKRIYRLRKRNSRKPFLVLISSIPDLKLFGVKINLVTRHILNEVWPGKVSVILPAPSSKFRYLHRGLKSIAFRLPRSKALRKLLELSGPLVAPSANWEGKPPAENIREAKRYFGNQADFYIDKGVLKSFPSTLIALEKGRVVIKRQGAGKIKESMLN